jgi:hypothetical protein
MNGFLQDPACKRIHVGLGGGLEAKCRYDGDAAWASGFSEYEIHAGNVQVEWGDAK